MDKRTSYVKSWQELERDKGMIFLSGPRQAGKTTLTKIISNSFTNNLYFNWDIISHRMQLLENPAFFEAVELKDQSTPLIILDEIHKYKDWKNYLKGIFDQFQGRYKFLISGNGRLDIYQKGGDSLAGRYYLFHLWPFTISELSGQNRAIEKFLENPLHITMKQKDKLRDIWNRLSVLSGFPEPYLSNKITTYRRWSNTYSKQLIREDIRDLTGIKSIGSIETLYHMLPSKIASPISIPSLASNLKVTYNSINNWLSAFERFFLVFSISPWSKRIARAIHKERKVYLWDIPKINEPSARFENMVAIELFRTVTAWNDLGYGQFALHYIKNKEKQEVDFLIVNGDEPALLIEAKLTDTNPSPVLKKFQDVLNIPAVQLVNEGDGYRRFSNNGQPILVAPAFLWLAQLP